MGEARTRTIVRKPPRPAADAGRSRLGDLTRPIAKEQRIAKNRRPALLLGAIGIVVAGAIAAALFVLPVRTWFDQEHRAGALRADLETLQAANAQLQQEVNELQTDEGVRAAAREQLGYQQFNERRQTVIGLPALPSDLPDGWPYGAVEQILALRAAAQSQGG